MAVSTKDQERLNGAQQSAVQNYTDQYYEAKARGDKAGMQAAHDAAERVRNQAGYSGGADGSAGSAPSRTAAEMERDVQQFNDVNYDSAQGRWTNGYTTEHNVRAKANEIRQQMLQLEAGNRLRNLLIYEYPNSILLLRQDGEVLMMNPRAERVGGIASVAWDEPHDPVLMKDLAVFRDIWAIGSQNGLGEMESSVVLPVINKNGQQKQYRYQYFTLNQQKDCALLVEDVTEEENRRNEIYEANKNQTLNRLIAGIAHEIKNPLMSIQAFASIIREQGNDKDFQESFAQYVPQEVGRINRLIESLINYAKPVNGIKERVDAQRLTNECVYLVSASVKNKQITFSCHNAVSAYIQVNRDQIKQALLNLLINSIESVEERLALEPDSRPSILVTVVKENGTVRISVRDEGTGMSDESIQNCIEPFYTTKKTGTGMGLSLAKQFVTENGGQFHLTSQLNVYTEISMLFKEDIQE